MSTTNYDDSLDDLLILVDEQDQQTGVASKLEAHQQGLLHRAFSVLLWRAGDAGPELLLQRRALRKYHSGGLWANSCCSHPRDGESLEQAVPRRLAEELGVDMGQVRDLREVGSFTYCHWFSPHMCEHEFDHVFVAYYDGMLDPDPNEVMGLRWMSPSQVEDLLVEQPQDVAVWFADVLERAKPHIG